MKSAPTDKRELLGSHSAPLIDQNGQPLLENANLNGLLISRNEIPVRTECGPQFTGVPMVVATIFGIGRRWYRWGGKTREFPISPGIDVYSASHEREHGRWDNEPGGHTATIQLTSLALSRYLHEGSCRFDLDTRCAVKDDFLVQAVYSLADEMRGGKPHDMLYAEGLAMVIVGCLRKRYSIKSKDGSRKKNTLSGVQKERIRQFIDSFLGDDLRIERLASEVNVSPFHFQHLFRASFGTTPHRYVVQERISRAATLLRSSQTMSIADIALAVGFSEQCHFTCVFKSLMGETPARWRKT